ncbi:hypothetical protein ACRAWD_19895 [Caulobacter segnis]
MAIYATRKSGAGDTRGVRCASRCSGPTSPTPCSIGLHGDTDKRNVVEHIRFEDIDILGLDEDDPEYQGALAISAGDSSTVRDIVFDGVRVEQIEEGKLFNVRTVLNAKYGTSPGLLVDGVHFRNISFTGAAG